MKAFNLILFKFFVQLNLLIVVKFQIMKYFKERKFIIEEKLINSVIFNKSNIEHVRKCY